MWPQVQVQVTLFVPVDNLFFVLNNTSWAALGFLLVQVTFYTVRTYLKGIKMCFTTAWFTAFPGYAEIVAGCTIWHLGFIKELFTSGRQWGGQMESTWLIKLLQICVKAWFKERWLGKTLPLWQVWVTV